MSSYGNSLYAPEATAQQLNSLQQNLDPQAQQQQQQLQARQKLIQSMMAPSQPPTTGWGGLANAGSAIAGAMAQRNLQGQQQQIGTQNWARNNPFTANLPGQQTAGPGIGGASTSVASAPQSLSVNAPQLPSQKSFLSGIFQ